MLQKISKSGYESSPFFGCPLPGTDTLVIPVFLGFKNKDTN